VHRHRGSQQLISDFAGALTLTQQTQHRAFIAEMLSHALFAVERNEEAIVVYT
jgi:hypothetical protein